VSHFVRDGGMRDGAFDRRVEGNPERDDAASDDGVDHVALRDGDGVRGMDIRTPADLVDRIDRIVGP